MAVGEVMVCLQIFSGAAEGILYGDKDFYSTVGDILETLDIIYLRQCYLLEEIISNLLFLLL